MEQRNRLALKNSISASVFRGENYGYSAAGSAERRGSV